MPHTLAVRREDRSTWERRAPLTPAAVRRLISEHDLRVLVQSSSRRIFTDKEYQRAGAIITNDLSDARVVVGIKEVPADRLEADTTYVCFAHAFKGQPDNMPLLARFMDLGCTLVDYERIVDEEGSRLIFFGRFAGLAGMIDSLWALGQRLRAEGVATPFSTLQPAHAYPDLDAAKDAVRAVGHAILSDGLPAELTPLVVGVTGYGNVAGGAEEILALLPTEEVGPTELAQLEEVVIGHPPARQTVYRVAFREEDWIVPHSPEHAFELTDYYDNPERYRSRFADFLPHLSVLVNCIFWADRYPRLVTLDDIGRLQRDPRPRLRVIGDVTCDREGSIECTLETRDPSDPVYVVDPSARTVRSGFDGNAPVVLAVDILPTELPRESSEAFSHALMPLVAALTGADYDAPFADLRLPAALRRAVIVHHGQLTPDYLYLAENVAPFRRG